MVPFKIRLDQAVVEAGCAQDIKEAQALILAGKIVVNDQRMDKAGKFIPKDATIRLKGDKPSAYVSRAGDKLASAISAFHLEDLFQGALVLDVGASTGGFTDCVLTHGAKKVVALDVGTNQLHWKLRQDPRVISKEKTHMEGFVFENLFDWILVDVSFISLARLVPSLCAVSKRGQSQGLLLVKPQFELPRHEVGPGGIVSTETLRQKAVGFVTQALEREGCDILGQQDSGVTGRKGNQEIFLWVRF